MAQSATPTFAARWARAVGVAGDHTFLVWEDSDATTSSWSYSEFDEIVRGVARTLIDLGTRAGDSVHVALTNSPTFVAIWLAAVRLGARFVPCDPHATTPEIALQLDRVKPRAAVASVRRTDAYLAAKGSSDMPLFLVDEDDIELAALLAQPIDRGGLPEPDPLDPAAVMFTSGTTSLPKGVVVTQANYAFAGDAMAAAAGLRPSDRQIVALPLFHANAQYYSFAAAISVGASVALMNTFSASRFLSQAARHGATHASLFAAPMRMILAKNPPQPPDLRLRHVWFAQDLSAGQYERLCDLFGCRPRQLYGMTETMPAVLTSNIADAAPDCIGSPTPGCAVRLAAVPDQPRAGGFEVGELQIGGRRGVELFLGYLDDESTTEASFAGEWFRTGDLAWRDDDGLYHFAGRRGDVLKVSGENVSLPEVEAVLAEHPGVFEVAVVGRPDPVRDEVPVAYVVPAVARPTTVAELTEWCAGRLAPAKRPRDYTFVDELPRTSVGKIRKFLLKERPAHLDDAT